MLPPVPPSADPVRTTMLPLWPLLAVPVTNESQPLTPLAAPLLAVRMLKLPLEVREPKPVDKDTPPPRREAVPATDPAATLTRPPAAELPSPTSKLMLPAAPLVAVPVRSCRWPQRRPGLAKGRAPASCARQLHRRRR